MNNKKNTNSNFDLITGALAFIVCLFLIPMVTSPIYSILGLNDIGTQGSVDLIITCSASFFFCCYPYFYEKRRSGRKNNQEDSKNQ